MRGEMCESLDVNARRVEGDRLFAIGDANGKFGSGKSTGRFRRIDGFFGFRAVYEGDVLTVLFPDGRAMRGDSPDINAALSDMLGQPVNLARESGISHLDAGPVHLLPLLRSRGNSIKKFGRNRRSSACTSGNAVFSRQRESHSASVIVMVRAHPAHGRGYARCVEE
jgi:hypothetical protein